MREGKGRREAFSGNKHSVRTYLHTGVPVKSECVAVEQ